VSFNGPDDFFKKTMLNYVEKTFSTRGTNIQTEPIALRNSFAEDPAKVAQWRGFIRKSRLTNVPQDFREVIETIAVFLGPVAKTLDIKPIFLETDSGWQSGLLNCGLYFPEEC
jgi:hypothetical protein